MITIGVIGIGYWGKHLLRNLTAVADVRVCCHTGSAENMAAVRETYPNVSITTDVNTVLADDTIDAVAIATPIGTHYTLVRRALSAGKDVFVEKPLASTLSEARELHRLAVSNGQILFVGYIYAHHALIRELRKTNRHVDSLGFVWEQCGRFDTDIYLDLACHPLSIAHYLTESAPEHLTAHVTNSIVSTADIVSIQATFTGSISCEITVNRVVPESRKSFYVTYTDGSVAYWTDEMVYRFDPDSQQYTTTSERTSEPLRDECENFVTAVENRTEAVTNGAFGVEINESIAALRGQTGI